MTTPELEEIRTLTLDVLAGPVSAQEPGVAGAWSQLAGSDLLLVGTAEADGGSGGSLVEAAAVLAATAESGLSLPMPESSWLAAWLAARAGAPVPTGPAAVVTDSSEGVPWSCCVERLYILQPGHRELRVADRPEPGQDQPARGLPIGEIDLDRWQLSAPHSLELSEEQVREELHLRRTLARTVQIAGAARSAAAIAQEHSRDRIQFGRRLAQFQVIQHYLARLAVRAHAVQGAAAAAVAAFDAAGTDARTQVHAAACVAAESVDEIAALAHQVVGAIGTTREHGLHRRTTGMWSWRTDAGDEFRHGARLSELLSGGDVWSFASDVSGADR